MKTKKKETIYLIRVPVADRELATVRYAACRTGLNLDEFLHLAVTGAVRGVLERPRPVKSQ